MRVGPRRALILCALLLLPGAAFAASEVAELEARLESRRAVIEQDRRALNAECGSVPASDGARVAECRRRRDDVARRMAEYKADLQRLKTLRAAAPPAGGLPAGDDLRPGGTAFFGLGGGSGNAPPAVLDDPMVVDLRHLRRAAWIAQAVETSTTEAVPALLDKALEAAAGEAPDLPAGAVAPAVDEQRLKAFRKAYGEYAETRAALAKSEAALKAARARKQGGGPEAAAAWEKASAAHDAAKQRAVASREEAVRILRALGTGSDPATFRPPIASLPALREETWVDMQKRMMAERAANDALVMRTQKALRAVVPPMKGGFTKVHEGVVLGFGTDAKDASDLLKDGVSPFNGKTYASMVESAERAGAEGKAGGGAVVVSFGTGKGKAPGLGYLATESGRVVGDHLTGGAISLNTPQAREAIAQISGKSFDRLVAHSNGATVAEALIREDLVRVNELDIVGGDMSLVKRGAYQQLVDSGKVQRVVVWIRPDDPVPGLTSLAPLEMLASGGNAAESVVRKLVGAPPAGVTYRILPPAPDAPAGASGAGLVETAMRKAEAFFAPHFIRSSYFPGIADTLGVDYPPAP
jgi:hypothetical protein